MTANNASPAPRRRGVSHHELGRCCDVLGEDRQGRRVHLTDAARGTHLYAVGGTRRGKSKLLERLIRQDILHWPDTREGCVLLDPHGSLWQDLANWLAAERAFLEEQPRPVVLLDFRGHRDKPVPSYNPLRCRPGADPNVVALQLRRAVAHAWGQHGFKSTPQIDTWLYNALVALYENGCTLADAPRLFRDRASRRRLAANVTDQETRDEWEELEALPRKERVDTLRYTRSRLKPFLANRALRLALGQPGGERGGRGAGFDWSLALDRGAIVLVNLGVDGRQSDVEVSSLVATLMLTDLWAAARARGKAGGAASGKPTPTNLYLDEFQRMVTPTIAEELAEASGFGLRLHLANQYPEQVVPRDGGGDVLRSVLANVRNVCCFASAGPADQDLLVDWIFRGAIDPAKVKDEQYRPVAVGQRVEYMDSHHRSETRATSSFWSQTESESESSAESWTFTRGDGWSEGGGSSEGRSLSGGWSVKSDARVAPPDLLGEMIPFFSTRPTPAGPEAYLGGTGLAPTASGGNVVGAVPRPRRRPRRAGVRPQRAERDHRDDEPGRFERILEQLGQERQRGRVAGRGPDVHERLRRDIRRGPEPRRDRGRDEQPGRPERLPGRAGAPGLLGPGGAGARAPRGAGEPAGGPLLLQARRRARPGAAARAGGLGEAAGRRRAGRGDEPLPRPLGLQRAAGAGRGGLGGAGGAPGRPRPSRLGRRIW